VQQRYKDAAKKFGVEVLSLAIGELNNIPYKSDPRTIPWLSDSIDVCRAMNCRVILLAFFHKNDLRDDKAGTDETVRRLKEVAPKAEKAGVILGIESWLSAEDHLRLIDRVGSRAVKVYYDVANSTERGYEIFKEIRWLGKQGQICEFHMKENGALLGQGPASTSRKCAPPSTTLATAGQCRSKGPSRPAASSSRATSRTGSFFRAFSRRRREWRMTGLNPWQFQVPM
jgi:L-ribulose-5-phosphate 3-epimerase